MSERSISQQFEYLGAPLVNVRWSWGAANGTAVVLRVWQDRLVKEGGKRYVRITHHDKYMNYDKQGWHERLQHVELVKAGTPCYLIVCRVKDSEASDREIAGFDMKRVWRGGEVIEYDGDVCVELLEPLPVAQARKEISMDKREVPS